MLVIALTSDLIRKGRVLGALDYGEVLGVDMYKIGQKRVSVCCLERMPLLFLVLQKCALDTCHFSITIIIVCHLNPIKSSR